jgi:hypothetical protein
MTSVAARNTLRDSVPVALDELRDSWAIAVAEVTAFLAYGLGRTELEALAVGVAVLAVRVVAGLLLPPSIPVPGRKRGLPMRDRQILSHHAKGSSVQDIAKLMKVSERYVRRVVRGAPAPPSPDKRKDDTPKHWYDHPLVRGTLTAGGFLGLAWTIYQILTRLGP